MINYCIRMYVCVYINYDDYKWKVWLMKCVRVRGEMIYWCIAVSQYDTGIDATFNVSIYQVSL